MFGDLGVFSAFLINIFPIYHRSMGCSSVLNRGTSVLGTSALVEWRLLAPKRNYSVSKQQRIKKKTFTFECHIKQV